MQKLSNLASIFFLNFFFKPPMQPKRHFALKDTFSMETLVLKKKVKKNNQTFQNVAKLFFEKKNRKKKSEKKFSAPAAPRHLVFFFGACGASFFFNRKMKILRGNGKKSNFFSGGSFEGGTLPENSFFLEK